MNRFLIKGIKQLNGPIRWSGNGWEWPCWILWTDLPAHISCSCLGSGIRRHLHLLSFIIYRLLPTFSLPFSSYPASVFTTHNIFSNFFCHYVCSTNTPSTLYFISLMYTKHRFYTTILTLGIDQTHMKIKERINRALQKERVLEGYQNLWGTRDWVDMAQGTWWAEEGWAGGFHLLVSSPAVSKCSTSVGLMLFSEVAWILTVHRCHHHLNFPVWSFSLHMRHLGH